jgi:hypothetical protein
VGGDAAVRGPQSERTERPFLRGRVPLRWAPLSRPQTPQRFPRPRRSPRKPAQGRPRNGGGRRRDHRLPHGLRAASGDDRGAGVSVGGDAAVGPDDSRGSLCAGPRSAGRRLRSDSRGLGDLPVSLAGARLRSVSWIPRRLSSTRRAMASTGRMKALIAGPPTACACCAATPIRTPRVWTCPPRRPSSASP